MMKEPKTGDQMFELMKADKTLMEEKYKITVGGWCAVEGPDTKKGKRLMSEVFCWMIIIVCWAHQMNLVVGDLLGVKHKLIKVIKTALEIITWFNGHSVPLAWLQDEQQLTYPRSYFYPSSLAGLLITIHTPGFSKVREQCMLVGLRKLMR